MAELGIFEFPLTLIGALALLAGVFLASSCIRKGKSFTEFVISRIGLSAHCSSQCAAVLLLTGAILMAIEGTWGIEMFHTLQFWVFVLVLMFSCALAVSSDIVKVIERIIGKCSNGRTSMSFALISLHAGFFLILCGGFFGAPDFSRLQYKADKGVASNIAYDSDGAPQLLPFHITLEDFRVNYYERTSSNSGCMPVTQRNPKQFTSTLNIEGKRFETSVNHPCLYKGYRIYQADYDKLNGRYSILMLVKDPWVPVVFVGMALMSAGAVLEIKKLWKSRILLISAVLLAIAFAVISLARIRFATLMPALRSLWFVPHLIFYMLSYSLLAISLVIVICYVVQTTAKRTRNYKIAAELKKTLTIKCLKTSMLFMLLGMLCGAVWAKYAWGDYWTWDAKECWAAATWLLTLAAIHIRHVKVQYNEIYAYSSIEESSVEHKCSKVFLLLILILAAFAAMQITWYGVNSLPSSGNSLHTYTKGI